MSEDADEPCGEDWPLVAEADVLPDGRRITYYRGEREREGDER